MLGTAANASVQATAGLSLVNIWIFTLLSSGLECKNNGISTFVSAYNALLSGFKFPIFCVIPAP